MLKFENCKDSQLVTVPALGGLAVVNLKVPRLSEFTQLETITDNTIVTVRAVKAALQIIDAYDTDASTAFGYVFAEPVDSLEIKATNQGFITKTTPMVEILEPASLDYFAVLLTAKLQRDRLRAQTGVVMSSSF